MSHLTLILVVPLLLGVTVLSAVVSALETALFCLKEHHASAVARDRPRLKEILRGISRDPQRSLHQIILLSAVTNLTMAVLGLMAYRESAPWLPGRNLFSAVIFFGVLVFFADPLPTLIALSDPGRVFRLAVTPFLAVSPWLDAVSEKLERATEWFSQRLIPRKPRTIEQFTDEEIETLIEMRQADGTLMASESEIIQDIIKLGNKTTKDCMTPRVDSFMVPSTIENRELFARLRAQPAWHWLAPVYEETPDLVIGMIDVRSWLEHPEDDFRKYVVPPLFLPETMNALDAFRSGLRHPRSLAVVVDEYGGVEGVLSHSDIVEEILLDAAPSLETPREIAVLDESRLQALGGARLDEIGELLDLDLEHEGLDTIGGLIFNELGYVPPPGARIEFPGFSVLILRCRRQRITEVFIERAPLDARHRPEPATAIGGAPPPDPAASP